MCDRTLGLLSLPIVLRKVYLSDYWWHVALGRWIVEERRIPTAVDMGAWYFTPVQDIGGELRWTWLGDVLMFLLQAAMGPVGVQLLTSALFGFAAWALVAATKVGRGPALLVILVALAIGTYQLQLPRNSLVSLGLYPLLFLLYARWPVLGWSQYAWFTGIIFIWSHLHGSCMLGWATVVALCVGRQIEIALKGRQVGWNSVVRSLALCAAALVLMFGAMSYGRPGAGDFFKAVWKLVVAQEPADHNREEPGAGSDDGAVELMDSGSSGKDVKSQGNPFVAVKIWLNRSIWKSDPNTPFSADFWSPFDMPRNLPVIAAFSLVAAALVMVFAARFTEPGPLLAWAGACFLGLGYARMIGYMSLASVYLIFRSVTLIGTPPVVLRWSQRVAGVALVAWALWAWPAAIGRKISGSIPEGNHIFGFGATPANDVRILDWVQRELHGERVFTTLLTGSHAIERWRFEKPAFVDGFFVPHTPEVWKDYVEARDSIGVAKLRDKYGISAAVIENEGRPWLEGFNESPDWRPVAVGLGMTVFVHREVATDLGPQLFFNLAEYRDTAHNYSEHARRQFLASIVKALGNRNRIPAYRWIDLDPAFYELATSIEPELGKKVRDVANRERRLQ